MGTAALGGFRQAAVSCRGAALVPTGHGMCVSNPSVVVTDHALLAVRLFACTHELISSWRPTPSSARLLAD